MDVLETPRLLLRELTTADLDPLAALYREPDVRRYFPDGTETYEQTREELAWTIDVHYARYGYGLWAAEKVGMSVLWPGYVDGVGPCDGYALPRPVSPRTGG